MVKGNEGLSEDEKKALRGSKFAPLPPPSKPSSSSSMPRIPHPGGPVATNKAVALAKFLERKLQEPGGLDNVKPELVELAVKNAKETVNASGTSVRGITIRHVTSFDDAEVPIFEEFLKQDDSLTLEVKKKKIKGKKTKHAEIKEKKKKKKKNKNKKL